MPSPSPRPSAAARLAIVAAAFAAGGPLALGLPGCPSLSTRQTAETLPCGTWQLGAALDLAAAHDRRYAWDGAAPALELTARRGLAQNLDAGLKLYVHGVDASLKWRFWRGTWTWAVLPAVGFSRTAAEGVTTDAAYTFLHTTVLASRRIGSRLTFTAGPKLVFDYFRPVAGGGAAGLFAGATIGLDLAFGRAGRWHLLPELNLVFAVVGDEPVDGAFAQGGVGLALDL
jgi:hypothetical protein